MLEQLKQLWTTISHRSFSIVVRAKHPLIYAWVLESTDGNFETFNERVQWLISPTELICTNGKRRKFSTARSEYGFCGKPSECACHTESITKRGKIDSVFSTDKFLEDRKRTWIEKYGVDNPTKVKSIAEKISKSNSGKKHTDTRIQLYKIEGFSAVVERLKDCVSPLFTLAEYKGSARNNIYKWQCKTCNKEIHSHIDYGTVPRCTVCNPKEISVGEQELADYIKSIGFDIESNTKKIITPQELDIYVPAVGIAFEYNGSYWHSAAKKDKFYHVDKYLSCKEKDIHLIQIFDDEWLTKKDIVKSRIRNLLGVSDKIYARKCVVQSVNGSLARDFLIQHHLQGYVTSSINLGLYFENRLVALMTFGTSRFNNTAGYELLRYCSAGTIVGGASKLFSHFLSAFKPVSVLSYADRCWSTGNVYRKMGFVDVTGDQRNTGFFYIKNGHRYHRSSVTKQRLIKNGGDATLTGDTLAAVAGYHKIYNCGNYKFLYESPVDKTDNAC